MKICTLLLALLCTAMCFGQNDNKSAQFVMNDCAATYKGGNAALINHLSQNMKYPEACLREKLTATVVVKFIVEVDGTVSNVNVVKTMPEDIHEDFKTEAIRVVSLMDDWQPAKCNAGLKQRSYYRLPVSFKL